MGAARGQAGTARLPDEHRRRRSGPAGSFSMRAVAVELGTGAGSLYWHVRGKEELLNLMVDRVIGELEIPDPDPPDGRSRPRSSPATCGGC